MKARSESKPKSAKATGPVLESGPGTSIEEHSHEKMIAEAAYYRAQRRGFAPGYELADWLQAEADLGHLF